MSKEFYETISSYAGFAGESFDIAAGPANPLVISNLLSAGNGVLTQDAPHVLISTGVLGNNRILSISDMEKESNARGGQDLNGRFFYLSVQNSDITSYSITVSGSSTINGQPTYIIDTATDYLFHFVSNGNWRVNELTRPEGKTATLARVDFLNSDWTADIASPNTIVIIQEGSPIAGEVGPHKLTVAPSYSVQIVNKDITPNELVDVEVQFDASGNVTLRKAELAPDFNGTAVIIGTLD